MMTAYLTRTKNGIKVTIKNNYFTFTPLSRHFKRNTRKYEVVPYTKPVKKDIEAI